MDNFFDRSLRSKAANTVSISENIASQGFGPLLSAFNNSDDDKEPSLEDVAQQEQALRSLVALVERKYKQAKEGRRTTEEKWLSNWKQFNSELSAEQKARVAEAQKRNPSASSIFIPVTKTKTMAAYGQLIDIVFADQKFPLEVKATPQPEGIAEAAYIAPEQAPDIYGYEGDGRTIEPGATAYTLENSILGGLKEKYQKIKDAGKKFILGQSPDPKTMPTIHPAEEAAIKMNKIIQDQLQENRVEAEICDSIFEMCVFGTGAVKGPFTTKQIVHNWERVDGSLEYTPTERNSPIASFVSIWNLYPDPTPRKANQLGYMVERHLVSNSSLAELKLQPYFNNARIDYILERGTGKRVREYWENQLQDNAVSAFVEDEYEILEYWGYADRDLIAQLDLSEKERAKINGLKELIQVNIWVCGGEVIKFILNPFTPSRIPYFISPYEELLYQVWGKGIPDNMAGSQDMVNGHAQMAIDNLKFSGSVMLEVNENQLVPGQNMIIFPGKIWRKQSGAPGQSVFGITTPNVSQQHFIAIDKALGFADQATGLPSYQYGQYTTGQSRTASGMSMLMQAASLNIKTVVKNIDRYIIEPMGQAFFQWNMQFNSEVPDIRGDLKIISKGTSSLMQKEVKSQRLMTLLQVGSGPTTAPFMNVEYLLKEICKSLGIDPDAAVNDQQKAALYAEILGKLGAASANQQTGGANSAGTPPGGGQGGSNEASAGANPSDTSGSGGGNIGVGSVPQPGQNGFSASA